MNYEICKERAVEIAIQLRDKTFEIPTKLDLENNVPIKDISLDLMIIFLTMYALILEIASILGAWSFENKIYLDFIQVMNEIEKLLTELNLDIKENCNPDSLKITRIKFKKMETKIKNIQANLINNF